MSTENNLDDGAGLECLGSLGSVGSEGGIRGHEVIGRDGGRERNAFRRQYSFLIPNMRFHTLGNLLRLVELGSLLLELLVTGLGQAQDGGALDDGLLDGSKDLVGNGGSILVLGDGIGVGEGVV